MVLLPVEYTILRMTLAVAAVCVVLAWEKGIAVEPTQYWFSAIFFVVMLGIGQIYRQFRDSERIALAANALALFTAYSVPTSLMNVLLLPRPSAPIDATLVKIDSWFGYSWPDACAWIANYPFLSDVLREIYSLTLAQLLFTFLFLGIANNPRRLLVAALGTVLASQITIFWWAFFPSAGASAYWSLPLEISQIVRPAVGSAYGAELNRLLAEGIKVPADLNTTGLVGFPSFHTVMVLISLIAVWPYKMLRYPLGILTAFMVPAILIQGGHNLCDVFGGVVVTLVGWRAASLIYDAKERGRALLPMLGRERIPA